MSPPWEQQPTAGSHRLPVCSRRSPSALLIPLDTPSAVCYSPAAGCPCAQAAASLFSDRLASPADCAMPAFSALLQQHKALLIVCLASAGWSFSFGIGAALSGLWMKADGWG